MSLFTLLLQRLSPFLLLLLSSPVNSIALHSCIRCCSIVNYFFAASCFTEALAATTSAVAYCHQVKWLLTLHSVLFCSCSHCHLSLLMHCCCCIVNCILPPVDWFLFPCNHCWSIVNLWIDFHFTLAVVASHCTHALLLLHYLLLLLSQQLIVFCYCWSPSWHCLHCCHHHQWIADFENLLTLMLCLLTLLTLTAMVPTHYCFCPHWSIFAFSLPFAHYL